MANKKVVMSATTTALIAALTINASEVDAASYKVQSGDTLWGIAQDHDTSVAQLKNWNDLTGSMIFPNQLLEISKPSNTKVESNTDDTDSSSPSTYTVQSGDTLSGIAYKFDISLSELMKWNSLDTTLIYPGDVFVVSKNGGNSDQPESNQSGSNTSSSEEHDSSTGTVYTVKSGDTLSEIAYKEDVSVSNLMNWNNLSSTLIFVGQQLKLSSSDNNEASGTDSSDGSSVGNSVDTEYNVDKLISTAKSLNGTGYAWGGQSPSTGFDCSGFIYYVYNEAGKDIRRMSSASYYNRAYYVNKPQLGDLVFFENTYKSGISHLGIYLGDDQFIHAGSDGVEISNLSNPYWSKHFDGYKRFY